MEQSVMDVWVAPAIIPSIMFIESYKQIMSDHNDHCAKMLYCAVTVAVVLGTIQSLIQLRLNYYLDCWITWTFVTSGLSTFICSSSIFAYHVLRIHFRTERLSNNPWETSKGKHYDIPTRVNHRPVTNFSELFEHHWLSDFLPGFVLFMGTLLNTIITYELVVRSRRRRVFYLGEGAPIAQLVSAGWTVFGLLHYSKVTGAGPFVISQTNDLLLGVSFVIFLTSWIVPHYCFRRSRDTVFKYVVLLTAFTLSYMFISMKTQGFTGTNPFNYIYDYLTETPSRTWLFFVWLILAVACVVVAHLWSSIFEQTSSLARKIFHLAISIIFISGLDDDIEFARFAAGTMLIIFLELEIIRAWNLYPIGPYLESICSVIRGKWDNKYATVTHMYLLLGVFLPLWIIPLGSGSKLVLASGVLSVGIGDSVAAIIGSKFGQTRWDDTSKTMEGWAANVLSTFLFKQFWLGTSGFKSEFLFFICCVLTAKVELITINCDNMILSMIMMICVEVLQITNNYV